jgi:hypothetical protein
MKLKSTILAGLAMSFGLSSSYGAIYNVLNGTTATANGIAPTGLLSDLSAAAAVGTFTGFSSPTNPGVYGFGFFGVTDSAVTNATQLTDIVTAFTVFGTTDTFNGGGAPTNQRGLFAHSQSGVVTGSSFSGKNIYLLVGNGATFGASSELLVLKNTSLFTDAQDSVPTAQNITFSTATATLLFGRNIADVKTTGTDSSATAGWGTAKAVPEPSAALLGALGALGLLRRRRI